MTVTLMWVAVNLQQHQRGENLFALGLLQAQDLHGNLVL